MFQETVTSGQTQTFGYLCRLMMYKGAPNPNGININLFQKVVVMFIPV